MEPTVLLEEVSPNGNIQALVEADDRVVYLYLFSAEETGLPRVRPCWVRNLVAASEDFGPRNRAPSLPRSACAHPEGAPPLEADRLGLVWFEEGDGVALQEDGVTLAVLTCWSGFKGFPGYARDCLADTDLAWPLAEDSVLHARIERARAFWSDWGEGETAWPPIREALCSSYERTLGPASNYYAIDGGEWPPKALLRVPVEGDIALVTVGVSVRPQPTVELQVEDPSPLRRIELGLCLGAGTSENAIERVMQYVSAQTLYPWERYAWLGNTHTFPCDSIPATGDTEFTFVLFLTHPHGAPALDLPRQRGDPVNLLWMIPITAAERELALEVGSEALADRLAQAGHGWIHRARSSVA